MSSELFIHIVPRFHPQTDGAGEYALNLARALRESYGIQSQFIVCDPARDGPSRVDNFVVQRLRVRKEAGIWNLLSSAKRPVLAVVLHYCPYGYEKHGLPLWLYRGIKSWLKEGAGSNPDNDKKLVTVFYDSMQSPLKPWNKQFCLRMPQRWLLQQIHHCSKFSMRKNRRVQFSKGGAAMEKGNLFMTLEDQPDFPGQSPDWEGIARRFYEALQNNLPDAITGAPTSEPEGGTKPKRPAHAPGLKLADHRVGRYRTPA